MPESTQMPLRIPASLHRSLKIAAKREGVSLNQYCLYLLARHVKSDQDWDREKGEALLTFLEEAQVMQAELAKGKKQGYAPEAEETPFSLFKKLQKEKK
jgi:hypothetical protein